MFTNSTAQKRYMEDSTLSNTVNQSSFLKQADAQLTDPPSMFSFCPQPETQKLQSKALCFASVRGETEASSRYNLSKNATAAATREPSSEQTENGATNQNNALPSWLPSQWKQKKPPLRQQAVQVNDKPQSHFVAEKQSAFTAIPTDRKIFRAKRRLPINTEINVQQQVPSPTDSRESKEWRNKSILLNVV